MDTQEIMNAAKTLLTALVDFVYRRVAQLRKADEAPELFTYFVAPTTDKAKYMPGEEGLATSAPVLYGGQVIDVVVFCAPGAFEVQSIRCGDGADDMITGGNRAPADLFFANMQNRFVRFTEYKKGDVLGCKFKRVDNRPEPQDFNLIFKVRSKRQAAQEVPND